LLADITAIVPTFGFVTATGKNLKLVGGSFACTCDRALTAIHHDRSAEMKMAKHIGRK
jgi:hypothetical protein